MTDTAVLEVRDLTVEFRGEGAWHAAVRGVEFAIARNETLALVGESGSGKSVTALAVMGLVPAETGRVAGGSIRLEGRELVGLSERQLDEVRGNRVAMIFQEPMTALNPTMTVGAQVAESLKAHRGMDAAAARKEAARVLDLVRMPSAAQRMDDYPHQFSGGMRQRVMIAMALSCNPKVLIADEPTTALDVTIQAQILDLMRALREKSGTAIILITHDMGVVAENADRVVVMYAGRKVEEALVEDLFERPGHPYTKGLLGSIPHLDDAANAVGHRPRLTEIKGMVPSLAKLAQGCTFAPRCSFATDRCRAEQPELIRYAPGHTIACWHADQVLGGAP